MKNLLLFLICSIPLLHAQDEAVVSWLNNNAIVIEDANPDTELTAFSAAVPAKFRNARVFGFGEASHHGKEFFDLKTKFFKYLVEKQGVRIFMMEESYQAELGINKWITGGEGDARSVLKNFNQGIWYTNEVAQLLQWMRDYNNGKPAEDQVRFYGIDNQFGHDINVRLRNYVQKHNIVIGENLLAAADTCSAAQMKAGGIKAWDKKWVPQLEKIIQVLLQDRARLTAADASEYNDMMRGLGYLKQYTAFIARPYSESRDRDMFDNVLQVLEQERPAGKAFIWAHNEHINKKDLYTYSMESLGSRLKKHFKEEYYAVGFDFGSGTMKGYRFENGRNLGSVIRTLEKPYKNTFAATLVKAQPPIYFTDMEAALSNPATGRFFGSKKEQLFLGGPGFDPEKTVFMKRKYIEAYDGLIFVNTISPATY
jgi:erythromycin esterase